MKKVGITNKQLRATAKQEVAEVLAVEEPKQKEKLEELVEGYKTELLELSDTKAAVDEENKALADDNELLRTEKKALEDQLKQLEQELSKLQAHISELENSNASLEAKLTDMERAAVMASRLKELEVAGLVSEGKVTDKFKARIKKMGDEEFADYKTELVGFKSEWEKSTVAATSDSDSGETEEAEVLEDHKFTAAQILKLRKQLASFNVASQHTDMDELGIPEEMKKDYAGMWD